MHTGGKARIMLKQENGHPAGENVLVTVRGLQSTPDDDDSIEVVTRGRYYERAGKSYVFYEEEGEEPEEKVRNLVEISPEHVEVIKKGLIDTRLSFEKGQKLKSMYQTPFGRMEMGVFTENIEFSREDDGLKMELDYRLEVNNEHVSINRICLSVEKLAQ